MADYRAYPIDDLGHMMPPKEFACTTDHEAVAQTKKLLNGNPIEIWEGVRLVARLEHNVPDRLFE